jgi:uncharacterized protein (DUF2267 family)
MHTFERLLTAVRLGGEMDRAAAERTVQAVLTPFLERVSGGQADDLARELRVPDDVLPGQVTVRSRPADAFDLAELLERVAGREGIDTSLARRHAVVVLQALRMVVSPRVFRDAVDQLPAEFAELLSAPWRPRLPVLAGRDLVQRVADSAQLPAESAGQATEGVLEVLAERLPDRTIGALSQQLPADLQPALERGRVRRTAPRALTVDALLELLGERLATDPARVREHARAVLSALAETVDDELLGDLLVELPDDFADLVTPDPSRRSG